MQAEHPAAGRARRTGEQGASNGKTTTVSSRTAAPEPKATRSAMSERTPITRRTWKKMARAPSLRFMDTGYSQGAGRGKARRRLPEVPHLH